MNDRKIIKIIIISFLVGIVFTAVTYFNYQKFKPLVKRGLQRIEEKRFASTPKAKTPLVISDFEERNEIQRWEFKKAEGQISTENVTSGKRSLKVNFLPSNHASLLKIEEYLSNNMKLTDWSRYEVVRFDIFNPSKSKQGVVLQIKDVKDKRYKQKFTLNASSNNRIEIAVAEFQTKVNTRRIGQFELFLWKPKEGKTLFIDNIVLLPSAQFEKLSKPITSEEFIPKNKNEIYKTGYYFDFSEDKQKWIKKDILTQESYIELPLSIKSNEQVYLRNFPVSGGLPFPLGELNSKDNIIVVDSENREIPAQSKVLCSWPDKSIKWLLLNLEGTVSPTEQIYFLRYSPLIKSKNIDSPLNIIEEKSMLSVITGPMKFSLSKNGFRLFDKVWLDTNSDGKFSNSEIISEGGDLVLVHNGREYRSSFDKNYKLEIEEEGPLKIGLKASGWFTSNRGKPFCKFIVRIKAFKDKSYLKIDHTFVYTGYPENKQHYLYKGKRLPRNETIDAIYIETPIDINSEAKFTFEADSKIMQGDLGKLVDFYQETDEDFEVIKDKKVIEQGSKLFGWVDLSNDNNGLTVLIKDFWQQFPKGFRLDRQKRLLTTDIWPQKAGELDFRTSEEAEGPGSAARGSAFGIAKTHSLMFYFHKGNYNSADSKAIAKGFKDDILIRPDSMWISDSKATGKLSFTGVYFQPAEAFLDRLFNWAQRQIHDFRWYGMIDFGDTLSWYREEAYDKSYNDWGWHPEGRWGWFNCEAAGTHTGALLQYMRTGEYKYYRFGKNLARHIMDVDTCHYNTVANDKRLTKIIPDDYSRVGSIHRHNADHWGGRNEEATHTNLTGIMLYYYLTGDGRARDVLDEIGSFFLDERITYYGHPDIAPQRGIANILWGDVLMYELTDDERYKKQADRLANLFYVGQLSNGAWLENYNPEAERWERKPSDLFMVNYTMPALIEYHKLTGNKAIAECIIKATEYLSDNVNYLPFFDALAYSYWLTKDDKFISEGSKRLGTEIKRQNKKQDPLWNGMLYSKAYYLRPANYLYSVPWIFEILQKKEIQRK